MTILVILESGLLVCLIVLVFNLIRYIMLLREEIKFLEKHIGTVNALLTEIPKLFDRKT